MSLWWSQCQGHNSTVPTKAPLNYKKRKTNSPFLCGPGRIDRVRYTWLGCSPSAPRCVAAHRRLEQRADELADVSMKGQRQETASKWFGSCRIWAEQVIAPYSLPPWCVWFCIPLSYLLSLAVSVRLNCPCLFHFYSYSNYSADLTSFATFFLCLFWFFLHLSRDDMSRATWTFQSDSVPWVYRMAKHLTLFPCSFPAGF